MTWLEYLDPGGTIRLLDPDGYVVSGLGSLDAARIRPVGAWPATAVDDEAVVVTFTAGWSPAGSIPAAIRQAILLHVGTLYENRESVTTSRLGLLPNGYDDLVRPFRLWTF